MADRLRRLKAERDNYLGEARTAEEEIMVLLGDAMDSGCHRGVLAEALGLTRHQLRHVLSRGHL